MAFDRILTVGSTPPIFNVIWSSSPTRSGHYVAAFTYGTSPFPAGKTAQDVIKALVHPNLVFNGGFLVLGKAPAQDKAQAFKDSCLSIINQYPRFGTSPQIFGGMILWLEELGAFDRSTAFGLFTPAPKLPYYTLDPGRDHRLFDAGGGRLLSVRTADPNVRLEPDGNMTVLLRPASTGSLQFVFGTRSVAASAKPLIVELDTSKPHAGCLTFTGTAQPALRDYFEPGFQHGIVPQGGLGDGGKAKPYRIFHPLLDRDEVLSGATVSAALNPLIPTNGAYNTVTVARPGKPFVSGYRTRLGDKVTLEPIGGGFQATPCLGTRAYFAPAGDFKLAAAAPPANRRGLLGGLSAVEYLEFADGDVLNFVAGQDAGVACGTVTVTVDGKTVAHTTFAPATGPDLTASQVSWAQLKPAGACAYVCEGECAPLFAGSQPPGDPAAVLDFKPFALRQLAGGTTTPKMPLLPYAGIDFGHAGADASTVAAFEQSFVAPTRLQRLETLSQAGTAEGTVWAVTPQGYVAQFVNGVLTSITLGTIEGVKDSSASLSFGSSQYPLTQDLCGAFVANQQFIVATCLTTDLQNRYSASATLSGWEFDVSLPDPKTILPGAYQTVLVIKTASGSVKQLAAEPYAWTAYSTFNDTQNDGDGRILSNWLTTYLGEAEVLYAGGNGLASLQSFIDLINDPDWNGFLYLRVPIVPGALDPSLQFLTAGIDSSQFFAHHVGCALNHTTVSGNSYQANSSYLGLVHYLRPGSDPGALSGTPTYVPQSVECDFQVLTLDARFENSTLIDFRSSARLLMSTLFGDAVLPTSPDPRIAATDALTIHGAMQTADGVPHYVFATARDASSTFFLSSSAFERIEIDRAVVTVGTDIDADGYRKATFQMSGWFGLLPAAQFDVLSYAAIPFDKLALDMRFQTKQPSLYTLRTDGVTLTQMPSRPAQDGELISAAGAAASIIYRPQSLAAGFPLQVTRLMAVTDATQTPSALGYRELTTQVSLGGAPISAPWYGLEFDLPLGGGGSLSSGTLFTARMLFAWAPGGTGQIAITPYFMLQGPGGLNLTLEIEGVLKLGAAGILLMQNQTGQFVLELASLGITVLGRSFPPAGTTNLLLAGVGTGTERYLGWFGAYVEADK